MILKIVMTVPSRGQVCCQLNASSDVKWIGMNYDSGAVLSELERVDFMAYAT